MSQYLPSLQGDLGRLSAFRLTAAIETKETFLSFGTRRRTDPIAFNSLSARVYGVAGNNSRAICWAISFRLDSSWTSRYRSKPKNTASALSPSLKT